MRMFFLHNPAFLIALTDLGDSSVLMAVAAFCSLYMLARGCGRGAAMMAMSFALAAFLIAVSKLFFISCDASSRSYPIHSPSGHAALSVAVYGAYALLAARQLTGGKRLLPLAGAGLLVMAIAVSRVALGFHTAAEVIAGLAAGSSALGISYRMLMRGKPVPRFGSLPLLAMALAAMALFHGIRLPMEALIHALADRMGKACEFGA